MSTLHSSSAGRETGAAVEAPYRAIFEHSMEAVLLTAPDGGIAVANSACTSLFGYTEEELRRLGRQAIVEESDPRLAAGLETRRRTGRFRGELTLRRKDGTLVEAELSSAVFRDAQGGEWTSMFIRDIGERKALEAERARLAAAREAEHRWLRAVSEHLPLGVIFLETDGRISFNPSAESMLGMKLSPERGRAQYANRILYRDGTPVQPEDLVSSQMLKQGKPVPAAEFLIERPDGSRVPILKSAAPIRDPDGTVIGGVAVFQNVSEHVQAQEAVRERERLLNGIFELLPVGVWIADRSGRIVRGNPAGLRIWAGARYVRPPEFGEYRGWWADTGKRIEPQEWALARALNKGETTLGEVIRIQCFDDSFKTIINSALPLYDDAGSFTGAIVVNEDITHLKEVEASLRQAIESRERVLAVVAHDLRNPLSVIQLQLELMRRAVERLGGDRDCLEVIGRQVAHMDHLIQDLLDVTRIESGMLTLEREPLAPDALVEDIVRAQRPIATAAGLELHRDVQPGLPEVHADRRRIAQVLDNLVGNAIKFTAQDGCITIGVLERAGEVVFRVADTGIGIDAALLDRVFDPLWQAKTDRRGVGLGLPIAKGIVQAHGGRIWVESTPGRGATFFFALPA
jgi:PAS domain S-box-containing protein